MSIPPRFLDEIRNRLTLSDIIGRRIKVTRAGREYKACCPFHHEKTPSFTINDDKQFYHCFGCGAHGDVIGFTMQHDNLSFMDAVETLAGEAGLQMPKLDPKAVQKAEKAKTLHELMDEASKWFQQQLVTQPHEDVLAYVRGRGLDEKSCSEFKVGYAPADGQALRSHLKQKGFEDKQLLEAGLLKESTKGGQPYIFFRDRVMFPVSDRRGRVVAFGGRILPDHMRPQTNSDFTPPKYINTAETELFDKGRMLYAESIARRAAHDGHTLVVTEGYMDVIACHRAGFKGAVAPMGTALTDDQILSLWSMQGQSDRIPVLCFDGDNAGRRAASRACDNLLPLLKAGHSARFAFLPEGEDPDSLLRSGGRAALQKVLEGALSLFDFIWLSQTAGRKFDTPEARAGLTKQLNAQIARIADSEVQRHYKELVRNRISEKFFTPYNRKTSSAQTKRGAQLKKKATLRPRSPIKNKSIISEKILLAALINYPELYHAVEESVGGMDFTQDHLNRLRQKIIELMEENPDIDAGELCHILKTSGFEQETDDILNESVYVHAAFCRPQGGQGADAVIDMGALTSKWMAIYQELQERVFEQERKQGWQNVVQTADVAEEEKLKGLVQAGASDA